MYKLFFILIAIQLYASKLFSQEVSQTYSIKALITSQKESTQGATGVLLKASDSSFIKTELANEKGIMLFENITKGIYIIKVSMTGHTDTYSDPFTVGGSLAEVTLPTIELKQKEASALKEVVVTSTKPFVQRQQDKLVVNVEGSIMSAGLNALEILERSPGIRVDQNDVIGLRGKQGVSIMINGKLSPLSGTDLAAFLRSLPAATIEKVEIITNPSSKYDASGTSGIINIVMKKDHRLGYNGTLSLSYGHGVYSKSSNGVTFNYRNKLLNIFGNYNYNYRKNFTGFTATRRFYQAQKLEGFFEQDNYATTPTSTHTVRLGTDITLSARRVLGFTINSNLNATERLGDNNTKVYNENSLYTSSFRTLSDNRDRQKNILSNLNYKHTLDSLGSELTADLDFGYFKNKFNSHFTSKYFQSNGASLRPDFILTSNQGNSLQFHIAKVDYSRSLGGNKRLEAGLKRSLVESDNNLIFYDLSGSAPRYDSSRSNHFLYEEHNNAGYVNYTNTFQKISVKFGARLEHTDLKGVQLTTKEAFDSAYLQVFPSAFLSYSISDNKSVGVSVSRRIDRPSYSQLNPFRNYIDPTTFTSGNQSLLPEMTWAYELNFTVKQLNLIVAYNHTDRFIQSLILPTDTNSKVTVQKPLNFSSFKSYGLTAYFPFKPTKWWSVINNLDYYQGFYKGNFGLNNLNRSMPDLTFSSNNSFTITPSLRSELNFNYISKRLQGFSVVSPRWQLGAGLQKTIMEKKGSIRLSVTDIFRTSLPKVNGTYFNVQETFTLDRDVRVFTFSFNYKFGKNTVAPSRKKSKGTDEEIERANSN